MNFNLPTVIFLFLTSSLCITALIGIMLHITVGIKNSKKRSDRIIMGLERFVKDNPGPLPAATRLLLGVYLLISVVTFGALLVMIVVILAYQVGFPLTNSSNVESLGFVSSVILLVAIVATLVLRILFKKIFKLK